ncbi:mitochondrial carrier domain-containing protein, partial [Polychytrium aggregatum]|uniref:mitochondrial carrier domain-containing protein n=1 Tax=Polychytrium aggregatum TaxID=110093 RepID=UPI0022FE4D7C
AGLAKALATKSAFTATAVSKGLLKWWFRFPVKLFRPVAVNPWLVFNSMAQKEGKKVSVKYVRDVVADEGWGVLGKNMMPLLVANACVGALLFNVYGGVTDYMEAQGSFHYHTPFVAGFLAGGAQAALATPLDNMQRHVNPADIVERRHEGIIRFTYNTIRQTLPSGFWASTKFLYTGLGFTAFKDALGFSMFFGVFEGVRHVGKSLVAEFFNSHEELQRRRSLTFTLLNALAVITAGAAAGMAYQVVIFPVENIRAMIGNAAAEAAVSNGDCGNTAKMRAERHMSLRDVVRLLRNEGFKPFYSGILPHLIRVMPPSALGLLAYEIASSQFFDNEDSLEN